MERYYTLTDDQYALIEPILKLGKDTRGRKPRISDSHALEAILYILREGCRWRAMPSFFGPWMTIFMRYKRWSEKGIWWKILRALHNLDVLEVKSASMDSTVIRAHKHAAGARKKGEMKP